MDILSLFIAVPVLTIVALLFARSLKHARVVALIGSLIQVGMAINLVFAYFREKAINDAIMVLPKTICGLRPLIFIIPLALMVFQ